MGATPSSPQTTGGVPTRASLKTRPQETFRSRPLSVSVMRNSVSAMNVANGANGALGGGVLRDSAVVLNGSGVPFQQIGGGVCGGGGHCSCHDGVNGAAADLHVNGFALRPGPVAPNGDAGRCSPYQNGGGVMALQQQAPRNGNAASRLKSSKYVFRSIR